MADPIRGTDHEMAPDPEATPPTSAPLGILTLLLALTVVLLSITNANTFAVHAGMGGPWAAPAHDITGGAGTAADRDGGPSAAQPYPVADGGAPSGREPGHGSVHLLHLVGVCLMVLLGGLRLLTGWLRRHVPWFEPRGSTPAGRVGVVTALQCHWLPPPLSPPTSSPVIRT